MEIREIELTSKEYSLLERSIRGDVDLSQRLCRNQHLSKNDLIIELLEEIQSFEYDEEEEVYEEGRDILKIITEKIYPCEQDKYMGYLNLKRLDNLNDIEEDIMITIKIG